MTFGTGSSKQPTLPPTFSHSFIVKRVDDGALYLTDWPRIVLPSFNNFFWSCSTHTKITLYTSILQKQQALKVNLGYMQCNTGSYFVPIIAC